MAAEDNMMSCQWVMSVYQPADADVPLTIMVSFFGFSRLVEC